MATITIAPFDDAAKKALLKAVADRGYANGLKAAAVLLDRLAAEHMRVVGTNTVRDVAGALRDKAASLHATADETIKALEATC